MAHTQMDDSSAVEKMRICYHGWNEIIIRSLLAIPLMEIGLFCCSTFFLCSNFFWF